MTEFKHEPPRLFSGSRYWEFNVYGAVVAGFCSGVLLLVIAFIVVWESHDKFAASFVLLLFVLNMVVAYLLFYPGNLVARLPYAIQIEPPSGLRLFAPYKEIFIPFSEIQDVTNSFEGYLVRLRHRRGLLKSFVLHWLFGPQRHAAVESLKRALLHQPIS